MSCHHNCSNPPFSFTPDNDISGHGVIVGFVGTAGLAVLIVLGYYLFAFRPELDPFRDEDGRNDPERLVLYRPNPVDEYVLRLLSPITRHWLPRPRVVDRMENSFTRCLLAMSDIQILTGLGILISGYAQLCNIAACNWQLVVYLAWFSSLTHLGCLTLLRNFLHRTPMQRMSRLAAMLIIVILLVTAIGSTGNYDLRYFATLPRTRMNQTSPTGEIGLEYVSGPGKYGETPIPSSYAICHFYTLSETFALRPVYASAIFSILLISTAFIIRVIKTSKRLSETKLARLDEAINNKLRVWLRALHFRVLHRDGGLSPMRTMVYWPLLMLYLLWRIILDIFASLTSEVWLLLVSFTWGVLRLTAGLAICGTSDPTWSFGQILPVFLLLAPLLTLWQLVAADVEPSRREVEQRTTPTIAINVQASHHGRGNADSGTARSETNHSGHNSVDYRGPYDDPFQDFYAGSSCVGDTIALILLFIVEFSLEVLVFGASGYNEWGPSGGGVVSGWWITVPIEMSLLAYSFLLLRFQLEPFFDTSVKNTKARKTMRLAMLWTLLVVHGIGVLEALYSDLDFYWALLWLLTVIALPLHWVFWGPKHSIAGAH